MYIFIWSRWNVCFTEVSVKQTIFLSYLQDKLIECRIPTQINQTLTSISFEQHNFNTSCQHVKPIEIKLLVCIYKLDELQTFLKKA